MKSHPGSSGDYLSRKRSLFHLYAATLFVIHPSYVYKVIHRLVRAEKVHSGIT